MVVDDPRYHGLDVLRAFAMALGVVLHATLPYFYTGGIWPSDDFHSEPIRILFEFIHIWRMPVFFILAGFFAHLIIQKRSWRYWWSNRLTRIGLPFLVFWPLMAYLVPWIFQYGFEREYVPIDNGFNQLWSPHHLWFLLHLLSFVGLFAIVRILKSLVHRVNRNQGFSKEDSGFLNIITPYFYSKVPLIMIVLLSISFIGSGGELIADLLSTAILFFFGYGLFGRKKLFNDLKSYWPYYLGFSVIVFVIYLWVSPKVVDLYNSGEDTEGLGLLYVILKAVCAITFSYGFIGLSERKFGSHSKIWRWFSDSSYWVYIIHLPIVTLITFGLFQVSIPIEIKFLLSVFLTFTITLITYKYFVRRTFIGFFLNGRRY